MTSRLNGEYLLNETSHRQSGTGVEKHEGSPTLLQNFMNFGPQTAQNRTGGFTHPHYFVLSQSIAHRLCGINVAPHSDFKWDGIGFVCSWDLKPQKMLHRKCYRVGRPFLLLLFIFAKTMLYSIKLRQNIDVHGLLETAGYINTSYADPWWTESTLLQNSLRFIVILMCDPMCFQNTSDHTIKSQ